MESREAQVIGETLNFLIFPALSFLVQSSSILLLFYQAARSSSPSHFHSQSFYLICCSFVILLMLHTFSATAHGVQSRMELATMELTLVNGRNQEQRSVVRRRPNFISP
jgi:hypothetical protein